jgi:DNA helicase II / ATP-dependent DNA helicase PcrA
LAIQLTNEQQAVVAHELPGHALVLAGPGTGKSLTAVALADRLMQQQPCPRIRFLTFTRAATEELAGKLGQSSACGDLTPSTLHSFAVSVLLQNPGCAPIPQPLRIPDDYEHARLIRAHLAHRLSLHVRQVERLEAEMAAKWESLAPHDDERITPEERGRFLGAWDEHRRIFGYSAMPELPDLLRRALLEQVGLTGLDYDLFVVDEYQDLNACELELLRLLAERGASIVALGDDDQSVYSWRKAAPEGIRRFARDDFAGARNYPLTVCKRSPKRMLDWAQHVIVGDTGREPRTPPQCERDVPPENAALLSFNGYAAEAKGIASIIQWLTTAKGVPLPEILVLFRTNDSGRFSSRIRKETDRLALATYDADAVSRMTADPTNRKALAVLRLLATPDDSLAWWTLMDLQPGIGEAFLNRVYDNARIGGARFGVTFAGAAAHGFAGLKASAAVRELWASTSQLLSAVQMPADPTSAKWGEWVMREVAAGRIPAVTDDFAPLLMCLDETVESGSELSRYLSQVEPAGKDLMRAQCNGVRFMTLGGSKGLTARAVVIVGVEDDLIPRPGCDTNEERRLLYVGMTRAQDYLYLTWSQMRRGPAAWSGRPNTGRRCPSSFLQGGPVQSQDGPAFVAALVEAEGLHDQGTKMMKVKVE